jgi:hypothetical protein
MELLTEDEKYELMAMWNNYRKQHRARRRTSVILVLLFMIAVPPSMLSQTASVATTPSTEEAQKANNEAQAEYYRAQTEKLKQAPPPKSFWQAIADNPASVLGVFGAFIAALVTLLSFFFNYRATLRNQRDTQFYEALKRFGDQESPAIRSSAAGLLGQMARTKQVGVKRRRLYSPRKPYLFKLTWRRPYFLTVLHQLVAGLLLEDNPVVISSISRSLSVLNQLDPNPILPEVYWANLQLQDDLVHTLAEFSAVIDSGQLGDVWSLAGSFTGYNTEVIQDLAKRSKQDFPMLASSALPGYAALSTDKRQQQLIALQRDLRIAAERLRASTDACSNALRYLRPEKLGIFRRTLWNWFRLGPSPVYIISLGELFLVNADLRYATLGGIGEPKSVEVGMPDAQLREADLEEATLRDLSLRGAQLQGANLINAKMDGTELFGARIDAKTNLEGATWWNANFYRYRYEDDIRRYEADVRRDPSKQQDVIDSQLLEDLFLRYGEPKVPYPHPSVQNFMERRLKWNEGSASN